MVSFSLEKTRHRTLILKSTQSNGFQFGIAVMITSYKRHFTLVPVTKLAKQLVPQLISVGLIVTLPAPLPVIVTVWCW